MTDRALGIMAKGRMLGYRHGDGDHSGVATSGKPPEAAERPGWVQGRKPDPAGTRRSASSNKSGEADVLCRSARRPIVPPSGPRQVWLMAIEGRPVQASFYKYLNSEQIIYQVLR